MALVLGGVTIDDDGTEHITPGMAATWYARLKAAQDLPDPDHKKGCTVLTTANPGDTSIHVDTTAGYVIGDTLIDLVYPVGTGSASLKVAITGKPDSTHFTFAALPAGAVIPAMKGSPPAPNMLGFRGTDADWKNQVLPQLVKTLRQIALDTNAHASTVIDTLKASMDVNVRTTDAGLQRASGTPTTAPATNQVIPSPGAVS